MAFALDPDQRLDESPAFIVDAHRLDLHGQTVRNLLMQLTHEFLANDLRRSKFIALVGLEILRVQRRPFRQMAHDGLLERLEILAGPGADRHELFELVLLQRLDPWQQGFLGLEPVDLVDD